LTIEAVARPALGRWVRRPRLWLAAAASVVLVATALALIGRLGPWADSRFVEHRMPARTDIPVSIAVTRDGVVWFTLEMSDAIGRLKDGRIEKLGKGSENLEPLGLATDADGSAWYTDSRMRAISRVSSDGTISSFDLLTPVARLGRLAVAPDGAVWFAEPTTVSVTRLKDGLFTRHAVAPIAGAGEGGVGPFGVAVDGEGAVWATVPESNKLVRISPHGEMAEFELPTRQSGPGDVAVDSRGTVWVLERSANKIARFAAGRFDELPVPTPNAGLAALAVAPDGSVWFTELRAHKLGRVRGNSIKEFALPRADARPVGVAVDQANNVWYTDLSGWVGMLRAGRARN
jgi:virginiamycin B lyase